MFLLLLFFFFCFVLFCFVLFLFIYLLLLFIFLCIGSGSTNKVIDWNRREMITVFSFSWLTETECLNVGNHLRLGATLEFQYNASQFELAFAFVKDVIPDVLFVYCTCKCSCAIFLSIVFPLRGRATTGLQFLVIGQSSTSFLPVCARYHCP